MYGRIARQCAIACVAAALHLGPGRPAAAQDAAVLAFVSGLNQKIAQHAQRDPSERAGALCVAVIAAHFDFAALARMTSAGAWDRMTAGQKRAYRTAFLHRVQRDCLHRNLDFNGKPLAFVGARAGGDGERLIATRSSVDQIPNPTIVWRTRASGGGLQAIDLIVDGRSLAITARDEAQAVLGRSGGDIDHLIQALGQ